VAVVHDHHVHHVQAFHVLHDRRAFPDIQAWGNLLGAAAASLEMLRDLHVQDLPSWVAS
jgi:hypothetical protein